MKFRVFQNPDGSVRIFHPNPKAREVGETDDAFIARAAIIYLAKDLELMALPFVDVDEADIPINRTNRHKWRVQQIGGKNVVRVDPAVPDPPDPKKDIKARLAAANSVAELKAVLKDMV